MMIPERIPLFLFVLLIGSSTQSSTDVITIHNTKATKAEGSCVTITCDYKKKENVPLTLLWFKDSYYDKENSMFKGTIVYSNTKERPQSQDYSSRVEFINDASELSDQRIKCNLRINDLQKTDSGNYSFRFISQSENKYMSKANMTLTIEDNPCKVHIEPLESKSPVKESDEFTVRCSTSGSCPSNPEWLIHTTGQEPEWVNILLADRMTIGAEPGKEGKKVTSLKIKVTWADDNRILSCRPAGSQDSCLIRNVTLSVEYAPKDTYVTVSSDNVKEEDSITISCNSRGHPNVTIEWFKNEKLISSESELRIEDVKPDDSGDYNCQAKNKHGDNKSNVTSIRVKYGPKGVTVLPSVNDLKEGEKLTLTCSVNDSNPPANEFIWYFKNSKVQLQTTQTLTISPVTPNDMGSYHCEANNGIKTAVSDKCWVAVKYSPRNIKIEGTTSVKVGSSLTLNCSADANPNPTLYTWKHTPGPTSSLLSSKTNGDGHLYIKAVTIQHAGQYTCDVSNSLGTKFSSTNVDVLYPPFELNFTMMREVREYEMISIICTVQSFPVSELTVTGPSNFRNMHDNGWNITKSTNMLTVYFNVSESDAGWYTCTAQNLVGSNKTGNELKVLYGPKNVNISYKGEQKMGNEFTLTCNARSKPEVTSYEWKKHVSKESVGGEQKLHFHSLKISDSGQYICIARNSIGKAKSHPVNIRVMHAPTINILHNMTTLTQGNWDHPVYLTCSADAYPPPTDYKWNRQEDKKTTLLSNQQNFTAQEPGMYYCIAANEIGASQSKYIMLYDSPNFLRILYQIILPIILLFIVIAVAAFLIRRIIIKGSRNNTRENLSMAGIPDPCHGRANHSDATLHSQDLIRLHDLSPRLSTNTHTVYAVINLPQTKQEGHSPKQKQKSGHIDNGLGTSSLNYATLEFAEKNEAAKRTPECTDDSVVYAMVSKNKQSKNSQSEQPDYENVSSKGAPKLPFSNIDWDSDTSEEDEVNYATVSCSEKSPFDSSSSDEEDRTIYSTIKHN
ncbi:B-cell receptor CD22 isoform X2 [Myxocyprinus asiaticus]|uniref:B-cell receptor CD22 isoform X2 n=1 Tax=Myxocyprinus asiaticus TaxID=70543 RepID=UPI0022231F5D|nr:B-cell receptor CD22 isoform X2 [Myxocyprinus asiaticus]